MLILGHPVHFIFRAVISLPDLLENRARQHNVPDDCLACDGERRLESGQRVVVDGLRLLRLLRLLRPLKLGQLRPHCGLGGLVVCDCGHSDGRGHRGEELLVAEKEGDGLGLEG